MNQSLHYEYLEKRVNSILSEFRKLTEMDSVSFCERSMADCLKKKLNAMGFFVEEDDAGKPYGGNAGNVYGFLKGALGCEPILLSAHMDTVGPGIGKKTVLQKDGRITSKGDTILGADDVAGLAEILWGIRSVLESGKPHGDMEVLFTVGEEPYTKGSRGFDFSKIKSRKAYVFDLSGAVGKAALRAPSLISFQVTVKGRAAHAGFEPEKGIHAILAASRAVSRIAHGRVDEDTTLNIGIIQGGTATNIVPEKCVISGEVRSYDHEKALRLVEQVKEAFEKETRLLRAFMDMDVSVDLKAFHTDKEEAVVRGFEGACRQLGITSELTETFGGSDCNTFAEHGICGIVLSCGMYEVHSVREYTTVSDLLNGAALAAELIEMCSKSAF